MTPWRSRQAKADFNHSVAMRGLPLDLVRESGPVRSGVGHLRAADGPEARSDTEVEDAEANDVEPDDAEPSNVEPNDTQSAVRRWDSNTACRLSLAVWLGRRQRLASSIARVAEHGEGWGVPAEWG